ncbi:MAG: DUF433 domain-containing protein, partial [Fimbriimonadales bacterium]|nr:DUF433 domain-containing protein [Fimbriimonadales bacterium]
LKGTIVPMKPQELIARLNTPPLPLRLDENGAIRVGDTRITLETVLTQFQQGSSPEMIVLSFPTLRLENVYTLIAYYLHNRALIDEYLQTARQDADEWFAQLEAQQGTAQLRQQLIERAAQMAPTK